MCVKDFDLLNSQCYSLSIGMKQYNMYFHTSDQREMRVYISDNHIATDCGMLTRYAHWYRCIYLVNP